MGCDGGALIPLRFSFRHLRGAPSVVATPTSSASVAAARRSNVFFARVSAFHGASH